MMKERKENGRITRLQIEVFYDNSSEEFFIDITDPTNRITPYTIGAFATLDEALRYTYTTLDQPIGIVEVVGLSTGNITFTLEPLKSSPWPEVAKKDNVVDIRSKNGKDK
jgi:hypothetical protein|tara:strand:- start:105 stop:434 length:330 start_codon:yes stop_codon:yes gene_type:complete